MGLIPHRGPDDEGYIVISARPLDKPFVLAGGATPDNVLEHPAAYCPTRGQALTPFNPVAVLGHRRLSIVDLSPAGHQPMCTPDGRHWIVFNGEIYNHPALRRELHGLGHRFQSETDTEVILAAYAQWGDSCLTRLDGMFAFLIYDAVARTVFAARDRFGIKPLYYWTSPTGFTAFGSEIKQFSALPGWQPVVNPQRSYDFLAWGVLDHTNETLFDGVYQLPPGCSTTLQIDGPSATPGTSLTVERWYELRPRTSNQSFEEAASELRRLFVQSVTSHMQSDVPIGSCLSGGLDSSAIVCAVNDEMGREGTSALQHTFTAVGDNADVDESHYAAIVARATRVQSDHVTPQLDQLLDSLGHLTWHQDEPFGSTSVYAQWCVFQLAGGTEVEVLLDGQGADEQLAGYHDFFAPRMADLLRSGRLVALVREFRAIRRIHGYSAGWIAGSFLDTLVGDRFRLSLRGLLGKADGAPEWLDVELLGAVRADPFAPRARSADTQSVDQLTRLNLQMLLHWEDRNSMAHSIEARVPFLDHRLVEFVIGLPSDFRLSRGVTKRVLREAVRPLVPVEITDRLDKIGFATPERSWMLKREPERFRALLVAAVERSGGIIGTSIVSHFDEMVAGTRPFSTLPWRVISFDQWVTRFGVSLSPRSGQPSALPQKRSATYASAAATI